MYALGYPLEKGNSEIIKVGTVDSSTTLSQGYFCSQNKDGKIVSYDATLPLAGVCGRQTVGGKNVDITVHGRHVVIALESGSTPNGGIAYLGAKGGVSSKATDTIIGTFCDSTAITGHSTLDTDGVSSARVDLIINNTTVASSTPSSFQSVENNGVIEDLYNELSKLDSKVDELSQNIIIKSTATEQEVTVNNVQENNKKGGK